MPRREKRPKRDTPTLPQNPASRKNPRARARIRLIRPANPTDIETPARARFSGILSRDASRIRPAAASGHPVLLHFKIKLPYNCH